jgi:AraC-like DNA-binding protein
MDPLSEVLSLLKPLSYVSAGFDAGGDWSIQFSDMQQFIKCYAVVSGESWLLVDGVDQPVLLQAGDCFVLPSGRSFRLASDLNLPSVRAATVFAEARYGGVVTHNGGGKFHIVGSRFKVNGHHANLLLEMLPPIVHLKNKNDQLALRWTIEKMMQELREQQVGSFLIAQHLSHMMLLQTLRLHLAENPHNTGWLFALADKQISAAISAMHAAPAESWSLQNLAVHVGMSRSSFAEKFKNIVGTSPIDYLVRWRMFLAADRLTSSNDTIYSIASSLGYESESTFSTAFKRVMNCSPRQYGKNARNLFNAAQK